MPIEPLKNNPTPDSSDTMSTEPEAQPTPPIFEPTTPEPAPPSPTALRDGIAAKTGADLSHIESDEALINEFSNLYPHLQAIPEKEREIAALRAQLAETGTSDPQPAEPEPEDKPEKFYNPPDILEPEVLQLLERDADTGLYRAPKKYPDLAGLANQANAKARYDNQFFAKFRDDPQGFVTQAAQPLREEIKAEVLKEIREEQQRAAQQQHTNTFVTQNQQILFEHDESGTPVVDPATNEWKLSADGQAFSYFVEQHRNAGVREDLIPQYAMDSVNNYRIQNGLPSLYEQPKEDPPAEQPPPFTRETMGDAMMGDLGSAAPMQPQGEPTNAQHKEMFTNRLQGATTQPNRSGGEQTIFADAEAAAPDDPTIDFVAACQATARAMDASVN